MSRTVRWVDAHRLQVTDDPWLPNGVGMRARLFYRDANGRWNPPLPAAVELPPEPVERSSRFAGLITRSRTEASKAKPKRSRAAKPYWMLSKEPELWRLRR